MSQSSEFESTAKVAKTYEVMDESGASYVSFFFGDESTCAAKIVATDNHVVARLDFKIKTMPAPRDCGIKAYGITYQQGNYF